MFDKNLYFFSNLEEQSLVDNFVDKYFPCYHSDSSQKFGSDIGG